MATCRSRRGTRKRTCIGQRDREITVKVRFITPPADVNYDNVFGDIVKIHARIETVTGKSVFDDVALREVPLTHIFDIPFLDNVEITSEDWIDYNDNRYRILSVENVDERNIDWLIQASFKGPTDAEANKA